MRRLDGTDDDADSNRAIIPGPRGATRFGQTRAVPRRPIIQTVLGVLAFVGMVWFLIPALAAIGDGTAVRSAPACPSETVGPRCLGSITVSISFTRTASTGRDLYLEGIGWVDIDIDGGDGDTFTAATGDGHSVIAHIWHGRVLSVSAGGVTEPTYDDPALVRGGWVFLVDVFGFVAFVLLRWAGHARLWRLLHYVPKGGPERRMLLWFDLGTLIAAIVGAELLSHGHAWGSAILGLAFAAIAYGYLVPFLRRRNLYRFTGGGVNVVTG